MGTPLGRGNGTDGQRNAVESLRTCLAWPVKTPSLKTVRKSLRFGPTGGPLLPESRESNFAEYAFLRGCSRGAGAFFQKKVVFAGCLRIILRKLNFEFKPFLRCVLLRG